MFDDTLKSKVNREVGRLNGELCDLKEHEESLKIRRARLEVEMRQAIAMRDMFELLGRLDRQASPDLRVVHEPAMPEHPNGPQFVRPAPSPQPPAAQGATSPYRVVMSCPTGKVTAVAPTVAPAPTRSHLLRRQKKSVKPANIPTTTAMTFAVLREAEGWMRTHEITQAIRSKWWPGVSSRDVGPGVWKLFKDGRLERSDHGYRLPAQSASGHAIGNGATAQ